MRHQTVLSSFALLLLTTLIPGARADEFAAPLPEGVKAVWETGKAYRETTSTREQICLNGLWRWQPAEARAEKAPGGNWGFFKVPGCWPGITDYMQKDSQTVYTHPGWRQQKSGAIQAAWYQREISIPGSWSGRQITIRAEYLNSYAAVFVDGKRIGEMRFPAGDLDISASVQPGRTHLLSMLVLAMPLKGVVLSYTDSASAREVKGSVPRRGLCGDVYLVSTPNGPRITEVKVNTSVRNREISFDISTEGLAQAEQYAFRGRILEAGRSVKEITSRTFRAADVKGGRMAFIEKWMPGKLWDTHTPQNRYELEISLVDAGGKVLDAGWPQRFGFREFWIDGRDFYLNGTRIFLSAVPLDNAQISAALSTTSAARESMERLKSFGINFVYTHNYGCEPGSHLSFAEILRAADDAGMLVSLSQPHFSHYDWQQADADRNNSYARHAAFYVEAAQQHPSVVMYSMSHNATGYEEDMNPDLIDGIHDPRNTWAAKNAKLALRAEAIVKQLDPTRIVYHHASGNLGSMHAINFYPNFVPIQELSDWFEHWATEGVKPVFTCEFGAPFTWDWTMYRGWYKGQREFGSAKVPWEFCLAEWNAQFLGDRAYQISEPEKTNLRWEAKQFRAGKVWQRWDYPHAVGSKIFDEDYPVFAKYLDDNWRAFRTWGVSAVSPWEHEHFWKLRQGVDKRRRELKSDWENLQRPGFSPDYIDQPYERMDLAYERSDWVPTVAAESLLRNNRPLLAYIAGKASRFTSKDHNFFPGESVEKQVIVINNSREQVSCDCEWVLRMPQGVAGKKRISVGAGQQERIPLRFDLPANLGRGRYELAAKFTFSNGDTQQDVFVVDVLGQRPERPALGKVALFDPSGETKGLLKRLAVESESVSPTTDLSPYKILIIGKSALTTRGMAPDIRGVAAGLKVVVFEQTSEVLQKRFGFRVEEYGLRQVFPRIADHPILAGLTTEHLRDWRGEATILSPRLKYELRPRYGPTVQWCDIPVTRAWRCGNRGNVASVLIEKPTRGDWLPIVDGGFSLQYAPLLEYREGKGMVLFCQLDVTGRGENEPAADVLVGNLLRYVAGWKPTPRRSALYVGEVAGMNHLKAAGVSVSSYDGQELSQDQVLVAGPGAGAMSKDRTGPVSNWLKAGGKLLAIGLDQADVAALVPFKVGIKKAEHISAWFESPGVNSLLAGVAAADVENRDPRELPLVANGAEVIGDGTLGKAENANVVFCQMCPWQFDGTKQMNLKRTQRRATFLVSRLLGNMGVAGSTSLLNNFYEPVTLWEKRWLNGFYADEPEEWDDPYRFFRW